MAKVIQFNPEGGHPANQGNRAIPPQYKGGRSTVVTPDGRKLVFERHFFEDGSSGIWCDQVGRDGWHLSAHSAGDMMTAFLLMGCTITVE